MKEKLLLCSGPFKHPDFVTLDADPQFEPDILAVLPAFDLKLIRAEPWKMISLIHGIEHFTATEGKALMANIYAVLAPGGKLVLEQPNLESAAKALLGETQYTGIWERDSLWAIYGDPSQDAKPMMCHKFGYTPFMLRTALIECGFRDDNIVERTAKGYVPGRDFRMEAVK